MWAKLSGFSGWSGNMGCNGSRLEAQLRDLLNALVSFLAGDFWKEEDSIEVITTDVYVTFYQMICFTVVIHSFKKSSLSIKFREFAQCSTSH